MKIEKGVPLPERTRSVNKYGWGDMEPGDSTFFPGEESSKGKVANAAGRFFGRKGMKYAIRKEADGIRIWRLT